jgi:hypothetical protein
MAQWRYSASAFVGMVYLLSVLRSSQIFGTTMDEYQVFRDLNAFPPDLVSSPSEIKEAVWKP